jgi:hypothetical protein
MKLDKTELKLVMHAQYLEKKQRRWPKLSMINTHSSVKLTVPDLASPTVQEPAIIQTEPTILLAIQ